MIELNWNGQWPSFHTSIFPSIISNHCWGGGQCYPILVKVENNWSFSFLYPNRIRSFKGSKSFVDSNTSFISFFFFLVFVFPRPTESVPLIRRLGLFWWIYLCSVRWHWSGVYKREREKIVEREWEKKSTEATRTSHLEARTNLDWPHLSRTVLLRKQCSPIWEPPNRGRPVT